MPTVRRRWVLPSRLDGIGAVVEATRATCVAAGVEPRHCALHVPVALTEALSNAIRCGNGGDPAREVVVTVTVDPNAVVLEVSDEGEGFDLSACAGHPAAADWLEREHGRGLFLMRSLMSTVDSRRHPRRRHRHTVRLVLWRT